MSNLIEWLERKADELEARSAELEREADEAGEPPLEEELWKAGAIGLGVVGLAGLVAHLASNPIDKLTSKITITDPTERIRQESSIIEGFLNKVAAKKKMSRQNYDQYISTKIQLDAQAALENVRGANELAKIREKSLRELKRIQLDHYAELTMVQEKSTREIIREELKHKFDEQQRILESLLRAKEADLANEREQKKKDQELAREQREVEWDARKQIEYANRVHIFPLNHQLQDLRQMHGRLLDEIDKLEEEKTEKPSWQKKMDMAQRELTTIEAQIDGLEAQLRQRTNGKG